MTTNYSVKRNSFFNVITHQPHSTQIYLYAKDPLEAKYQLLFNKRKITSLKHLNDSEAFVEYSNDIDNKNKKKKKIVRQYTKSTI